MPEFKPGTGESLLRFLSDTASEPKLTKPLFQRCLELTGTFETSLKPPKCYGRAVGNFDKAGMSYGCLQFNLHGELQKVFLGAEKRRPGLFADVMGKFGTDFLSAIQTMKKAELMAWVTSWQKGGKVVVGEQEKALSALGLTVEMQQAQVEAAEGFYESGQALAKRWGLVTERGIALCFDIAVQNHVSGAENKEILDRINNIPMDRKYLGWELEAMRIVAIVISNGSKAEWVEATRNRKMAIAEGSGIVNMSFVNLDRYGIRPVVAI